MCVGDDAGGVDAAVACADVRFCLVLQVDAADAHVTVDVLGDGVYDAAEAHCQQRHLRPHQQHHLHDQQPKTVVKIIANVHVHTDTCFVLLFAGDCAFSPTPASLLCRFATCASRNDGGSGSGQTSGCLRILGLLKER